MKSEEVFVPSKYNFFKMQFKKSTIERKVILENNELEMSNEVVRLSKMESSKRVTKLNDMSFIDIMEVENSLLLWCDMEVERARILHMTEKARIMANIEKMPYNRKRFKL